MDPSAVQKAADLLSAGRLTHVRMDVLPADLRPSNETEAYAVQNALRVRLTAAGWGTVAGHKIGCTTPVMREFLGIPNPCAGGVFAPTIRHGTGAFRHGGFLHVGVECEVAALLGADLPTDVTYDRESVAPAVEAVMAAIEVVDDRWIDYPSVDTPTLIADDFFGAGCVLGEPVREWRDIDLRGISGSMSINGQNVGSGVGADIMGHPFEPLAWLANSMAERGSLLREGEFVLLGSLVETKWVEQGDVVEIAVEGIGRATARFE